MTAALVVLAALLRFSPIRAQAREPVALEWNAPVGCPAASDVLERVRKLAHSPEFGGMQLRAEATIVRGERARLHLKLILRAGNLVGERHIDGRTCDDLAGAAAVVLALLLNSPEPLSGGDLNGPQPPSVEGEQQPSSERASGDLSDSSSRTDHARTQPAEWTNEGAEPPREPAAGAGHEPRPPRRWRAVVQLPLGSLGIGPLPRPSFGVSLASGILFERWSLLAEAGAWQKQKLTARDQPDAGANIQRIEVAVRGCRAIPLGRFEFAPCLRVSLQHIWTRGTGVHVASRSAETTWLAAGVGGQVRYEVVHWFRVLLGIDAQVETSRPRISIDGVGSLGQLRPAAFTITAGPEWIL